MSRSSRSKKEGLGQVVTVEDCIERHAVTTGRVDKIELALFGKDGRGGMVKDIQIIKTATSIVRQVVLPLVLSVASVLITAGVLLYFHV